MDRYYVSIPDPTSVPEGFHPFRRDQFTDMVRSILCAFYDDGEILVTNFLLESEIAHTDQQIAESLGLPQRQVRSILEARLCKDFVTEAEIPNVGPQNGGAQNIPYIGGSSAWYRINPNVLSVTWYRLTQTERRIAERLKTVQETESYICMRCGGREFDSLRAVSLYSSADGLFHCDICEDVLQIRQNKQIRESTESLLFEFRQQFEPIKERLEGMSKMFVPRPIVIKKTVHEKLIEQAKESTTDHMSPHGLQRAEFSQLNAVLSASMAGSSSVERTTVAPTWIREAQLLGDDTSVSIYPVVSTQAGRVAEQCEPKRPKLEEVVVKTGIQADIKTLIETASIGKKEEETKIETVLVTVRGMQYDVEQVRENESLIDSMTDEEYMQFDSLMQSLGYR